MSAAATNWLPIRYREFYDIPRAIVVEHKGTLFFFSCSFDEKQDEYPELFTVYRLPPDANEWIEDVSDWSDLVSKGVYVGKVRVADLRFDDTKRRAIDGSVFNLISVGDDR